MIIIFTIYAVLALWGVKFVANENNVLTFDQTNALKGIGIMTVFFNHMYNDYLSPHGVLHHPYFDEPFVYFETLATVLFVGMFLFFSGYGVLESIKKKGASYINQMPVKRLGTTLFNFDIAVFVFLIASLLLKVNYSTNRIILSFTGWESIGNSNWYIFAILCCYLISYISFQLFSSRRKAIILSFLLVVAYYILMEKYKFPWWYNTVFCYPAGMLYSEYKEKINTLFCRKYILSLVITSCVFVVFYKLSSNSIFCNIGAIAFSILCVLFSMKVRLNSKALIWLGANLFPIYIYQRLPMYVIDRTTPELIKNAPPMFILICVVATLIIGRYMPVIKLGKK
mgnify:CR=1 FL=1